MTQIPIKQIEETNILRVDPDGLAEYTTLALALVDAVAGDVILLGPGVHTVGGNVIPSGVALVGYGIPESGTAGTILRRTTSTAVPALSVTTGISYMRDLVVQTVWEGSTGDVSAVKVSGGTLIAHRCRFNVDIDISASGGNAYAAWQNGGHLQFWDCDIENDGIGSITTDAGHYASGSGSATFHCCRLKGQDSSVSATINNATATADYFACNLVGFLNVTSASTVNLYGGCRTNGIVDSGDKVRIKGIAIEDHTEKTTPIAADKLSLIDSADSDRVKMVQLGSINHDLLTGYLGTEHVDWASASAGTIHTDNYIEGGDGTDGTAIHDDTNSEISAITEKTDLANADLFVIEDSAATNAKKRVTRRNVIGERSKSITIEDPHSDGAEDLSMWFTNAAITVTEMRAVVRGTTPSVTWTIRHGTSRSATGAEVVTGGTTTTDASTGSDVTTFDDATMVVDSFVWLETTAQTGTVDELSVTVIYTED